MKRVLVIYYSVSGKTGEMADFIAEGIRFNGLQAVVKKMSDIRNAADLATYDGYILGSPTFSLDIPKPVKTFLPLFKNLSFAGKLCGAFGAYLHDASYQHNDYAPALLLDILLKEYQMWQFDLGALCLQEDIIKTREGMKACQDYGKMFGQSLNSAWIP